MHLVVVNGILYLLPISLVRSSFFSSLSIGQNSSRNTETFSTGSLVGTPLDMDKGVLTWGFDGRFIICFVKCQKADVFLSIDKMWLLQERFFAVSTVLFLTASSLLSIVLSDGSRVVRHILYACLASFVTFLHRGVHHGLLDSFSVVAGGKCLDVAAIKGS